MSSFTPTGGSVAGEITTTAADEISSYTILNADAATADVEVEIVVPVTAVWLQIYNRTEGLTKVAFVLGESSTNYSTLPPGAVNEYKKKAGVAMSLYVQCPKAAQIIEVTFGHSA